LEQKRPPTQQRQAGPKQCHDGHVVDVVGAVVCQEDAVPLQLQISSVDVLFHQGVERVNVEDGNDVEGHEQKKVVSDEEGAVFLCFCVVAKRQHQTQKHDPDFGHKNVPSVSEDWILIQEVGERIVARFLVDDGLNQAGQLV